ncbi:MAG: phosphatidylglycerophosphatase A [Deltaproteobacteria bacterium]
MHKGVAKLIATFFYVGLLPYAPGTWATAAAIPFYYLISGIPYYFYIAVTVVVIIISVRASDEVEKIYGKADPGQIVADEVCGYLVTMILIPPTLTNIIIGFFLFRFFDMVKPPPARQAERLPGGLGVVMDDVVAGIFANIVLQIIILYLL